MSNECLAAIILRLTGVSFLISGLFDATYLPRYVWLANRAHVPGTITQYDVDVYMVGVRIVVNLLLSALFLTKWRRIAILFTKDCHESIDNTSFPR